MPGREAPVPVTGQWSSDPLDALLRPPIDETEEEKQHRLSQEDEARRVSQAIDDTLKQERLQRKKAKVVRLLLLGQSESGESTLLSHSYFISHACFVLEGKSTTLRREYSFSRNLQPCGSVRHSFSL